MLAAIVTVDVLLKKSDVRGALGWIGAAWFSPILGSLLYYLFGINRVTRRALKMSRLDEAQANAARSGDAAARRRISRYCPKSARGSPEPADRRQCASRFWRAAITPIPKCWRRSGREALHRHELLYFPR